MQDDLRQVLFSIFSAEVATASGQAGEASAAKYADGDRDAFVALLFGRNVRDHVLWLCHLIQAASYLEGGYLSLFFGPKARAQSIRALFHNAGYNESSDPIRLSGRQLTVTYSDGAYVLHLKYANVLIAIFELLLEVDFNAVRPFVEQVATGTMTRSGVSSHAKILHKTLVNFLNRQLPTRQAARKQGAIVGYLEKHAGGALVSESISDTHVLEFWREAVKQELADFRTYSSVVECFENMLEAAKRGQVIRQTDQPVAIDIGHDGQWAADGGYYHSLEDSPPCEISDGEELIQELRLATEAGIRYFASEKQAKSIRLLLTHRESVQHRPRTFLRYLAFGGHQAKISNKLRHENQSQTVQNLIDSRPELTYEALHSEISGFVEALRLAGSAVAHLLLSARNPHTLSFLPDILEDASVEVAEELSGLSIQALLEFDLDWGDVRSSTHEVLIERCLELLSGDSTVGCRAREKLQRAFSSINRAGFTDDVVIDTELMDLHTECAPTLVKALRLADLILSDLKLPPGKDISWSKAYDVDTETFRDFFKRIYGDGSW